MTTQSSKLVRGFKIGKLTLCFTLKRDKQYRRIWVCKCECGNYCKRTHTALYNAIALNLESACNECNHEKAYIRLEKCRRKIQDYRYNQPLLAVRYKRMWDLFGDLYSSAYEPREGFHIMRELVQEFGPVREWELENKNFSLDGIYEEEEKETMVIKYCDICGEKLNEENSYKNYMVGQTKILMFPGNKSRGPVEMRVIYRVETHGEACHEICLDCVRKTVNEGVDGLNEG